MTKQRMVEEYLIRKGSITSMEAIIEFWATRLSAIIFILKKRGWLFETTMEVHPPTGSKYARYRVLYHPGMKNDTPSLTD